MISLSDVFKPIRTVGWYTSTSVSHRGIKRCNREYQVTQCLKCYLPSVSSYCQIVAAMENHHNEQCLNCLSHLLYCILRTLPAMLPR